MVSNFTVRDIPYQMIGDEIWVLQHEKVHRVMEARKLALQDRGYTKGYYIAGQYTTIQQIYKLIEKQNEKQ